MPRHQALADKIRHTMHDDLVKELRFRQRNIVFPDTVRNEGAFYRNLASKNIYSFTGHRIFAAAFGLFMVFGYLLIPAAVGVIKAIISFENLDWITDIAVIGFSLLWIAVGLKITVNALLREDQPKPRLPKTYPGVKI